MICNRCGNNNDNNNKFCLRCGNQLIQNYNPMYNNQITKKKNNSGIIIGCAIGCVLFLVIMFYIILPTVFFSEKSSKLNTRYKVKLYLNSKYSNEKFNIVERNKRSKTDKSCGTYTEYVWTVENKKTGEKFEVISSKTYNGAFVCESSNRDTYSGR